MDKRKFNRGTLGNKGGKKRGTSISAIVSGIAERKINEMVEELFDHPTIKKHALASKVANPMFGGWLYLIKNTDNGLYKVGITQHKNPKERFGAYTFNKINIKVIYTGRHDHIHELEMRIHDTIKTFVDGCWFSCDMEFLCHILSMISSSNLQSNESALEYLEQFS